ncbi:glycoside hydrolase, partial [Polychytrium aggregatum]|uniref:glycoside hydrolase n=1 Tax=Polychytrium aggregatum TaxID=110093 RepID=UPI0022FE1414
MPKVTVTSGLVSSVVRTAAILIGVAVLLSLFLIPTSNHSPANPSHLLFHSHRLFENPGRAACGEALVRNPIIPNDRGSNDFEKMWFVRNMTKHAWAGYHRLASGSDELKPLSGKAYNWYDQHSLLSTAIDSLDTLLIMGLTEEYAQAKSEVLSKFNPTFNDEVSVFESTIRVVAGLLSAYELDGDVKLLNAAKWMADRLLPAFETPTGIPLNRFFDRSAGLAEAGTLSLELQYLSDALFAMEQIFAAKRRLPHLYPSVVSAKFLSFENENYGIGAGLDSFYEYLLKMWIATGDPGYWARYEGAITTIKKMIVAVSDDGQNVYIPDFFRNIDSLGFHHLTCFSGGMLGLGSILNRRGRWPENLNMGKRITETCYRSYQKASSGLGPEVVDGNDLSAVSPSYLQRPETVESIFYMWRLTHDPVYREWGWDIAQNGYASLGNVNSVVIGSNGIVHPPTLIDRQESFLIAETLKYLYLLFTDDDVVPLEKYVFNTEGHPLSIRGHGKRKDPTLFVPLHGHALFP